MSETTGTIGDCRYQVRLWLGDHVIANQIADKPHADRYAAALRHRFVGLRVTSDPLRLRPLTRCPEPAPDQEPDHGPDP